MLTALAVLGRYAGRHRDALSHLRPELGILLVTPGCPWGAGCNHRTWAVQLQREVSLHPTAPTSHLGQVTQGTVQLIFRDHQGWRCPHLSGPCPHVRPHPL